METGDPEQVRSVAADTRGKHRISAALKRLQQETQSLEGIDEEVEQLEKMEAASGVCKEILSDIETRPDPLLPITNGPTTPLWDRWFEGPQDKSDCRCWIL